MIKKTLKEKRLFPRINLRLPFCYSIISLKRNAASLTKNVSVGGMCFISEEFIAPSASINLKINIPNKLIEAIGKVVWSQVIPRSDRYQIGIEFIRIGYQERCQLADYINRHLFKMLRKG